MKFAQKRLNVPEYVVVQSVDISSSFVMFSIKLKVTLDSKEK